MNQCTRINPRVLPTEEIMWPSDTNRLRSNTTGYHNTVLGISSRILKYKSGNRNVFIGFQAGYNETGSDKLYIDNSSIS
jgi:hypothetical protein